MTIKEDLMNDHVGLTDTFAARRYFAKFETITGHLETVADMMKDEQRLSKRDRKVVLDYVQRLGRTFRALANKYLLTGRDTGTFFGSLSIDSTESGFPVFHEILNMAADAQQAERHLRNMPSIEALKDDMVRTIVGDLEIPTKLQFAMSQRKYYEALRANEMFWNRNDPELLWAGTVDNRRSFLVHWAVYDSESNLPVIYLMDVEDTGATALPKDTRRWPQAQAKLMSQSVAGLKLVTIAKGFDLDFDDLHPKRLRRLYVGPMYSSAFTQQNGPIRQVLEDAHSPQGEDWALAWTVETLESERVVEEKSGWFGKVEREVFALDPFGAQGVESGATRTQRSLILPQKPYQVLDDLKIPGFANVQKFVVAPNGRVISYN
ncbi:MULTISPECIES: hypothetical protein [Falsihalocynthiibacter]|uniref:hypothetical protein n=1 Tax=Falsihalocynthiibacter TaxID=2854182 RepID=UPI003001D656